MRRKALFLCLLLIFTCFLGSCGKAPPEENPTIIKSDLTLEALRDILVEKGDDIRFSDIPEDYFYIISSTLIPQLRYPISDEISFYIMAALRRQIFYDFNGSVGGLRDGFYRRQRDSRLY